MADTSGITAPVQSFIAGQQQQAANAPNPLQTLATVQSIKNAQQSNMLMQQDLQNKQQELQNLQTQGQGFILHNIGVRQGMAAGMAYMASQDPDMNYNEAMSTIDKAEALGYPKDQLEAVRSQMTPDMTGDQIRSQFHKVAMANVTPDVQQKMLGTVGTTSVVGPGGISEAQPYFQYGPGTPNAGKVVMQGAPWQTGMSPESGTTLVTIQNPDGTYKQVPAASVYQFVAQGAKVVPPASAPPPTAGAAPPPPAAPAPPGAPAAAPPPVPAPMAPPSGAAPPMPAQPPAPSGAAPGLNLGQSIPPAAMVTAAAGSANQATTDALNDVKQVTSQSYIDTVNSLHSILALSPKVWSGLGTDKVNAFQQLLSSVAPPVARALGISGQATDAGELWKSLNRVALNAGDRSDAALFAAQAANPNAHMTPEAMQATAKYMIGLYREQKVLALATKDGIVATPPSPLNPGTWAPSVRAGVVNGIDPHAFFLREDPTNGVKYYNGLSAQGQAVYKHTLDLISQYDSAPTAGMTGQ